MAKEEEGASTAVAKQGEQRWKKADANVEKARERLAQTTATKVKRDKIEGNEGNYKANYRRILPPIGNMDDWYVMQSTHFSVGPNNRTFLCPRQMKFENDYCPACEAGFVLLKQEGNEDRGRDMLPSWRFYCNTVEVDKDGNLVDDQPRVLALNTSTFDSLTDEFDQNGDLSDVNEGRNINFRAKRIIKKVGTRDLSYNEVKFQLTAPCSFPGGNTDIINKAEDISELTPAMTAEQIAAAMTGTSGQPAAAFGQEATTPQVTEGAPPTPALPPAAGSFGDADAEEAVKETEAAAPADADAPNHTGAQNQEGASGNAADAIARLEARKQQAKT